MGNIKLRRVGKRVIIDRFIEDIYLMKSVVGEVSPDGYIDTS